MVVAKFSIAARAAHMALFGLVAGAALLVASPALAESTRADKALEEALARDGKEFAKDMERMSRSTVIGTVARGPNGFYVTSLHPGEDLFSVSGAVSQPSRAGLPAVSKAEGSTQGGQ